MSATKTAKGPKTYAIEVSRMLYSRPSTHRTVEGTLEELIEYFRYTLETGKSYEHERGNKKVNLEPKSGKALVTALNNATNNAAANGASSTCYELV